MKSKTIIKASLIFCGITSVLFLLLFLVKAAPIVVLGIQQRAEDIKKGCGEDLISQTIDFSKENNFYIGEYSISKKEINLLDGSLLKISRPWMEVSYFECPYLFFFNKYKKSKNYNLTIPIEGGYNYQYGGEEKFKIYLKYKRQRIYGEITISNVYFFTEAKIVDMVLFIEQKNKTIDSLEIKLIM
jgi:hypothetical protein